MSILNVRDHLLDTIVTYVHHIFAEVLKDVRNAHKERSSSCHVSAASESALIGFHLPSARKMAPLRAKRGTDSESQSDVGVLLKRHIRDKGSRNVLPHHITLQSELLIALFDYSL